ncbi:MlaD family protein [Paraconexibacter antarcticus]|uniref:MlaD family protein n=1 Tax=Paraconexibacter antarcticus TaxID=2949664 RepID=A0ABY5E0X1_9ACTN|nr:MlaD family protein [Paraconexibacter antarcticus]UTI66742.1 MlaD family protein [Paraconexibacter antarcticus]
MAALAGVGAILAVGNNVTGPPRYRAAAVFDTAKGIVPGQLVKIAGVRAGTVDAVAITGANKARLSFHVDAKFAPFRSDARCRILPEGLISENFVECDPGVARTRLPAAGDGTPTVRLARTSAPVSLQDVIDVFKLPVDERIRVLIDELGLGTAGRGGDINAILRRANPALVEARRALTILDEHRRVIRAATVQSDHVLRALSRRRRELRGVVRAAAETGTATAAHAAALGHAVRLLPATLTAVREGLGALRRVAVAGTPVLGDLRAAAPVLSAVAEGLPRFTRVGDPAVRAIGAAAAAGRPALTAAAPVVAHLREGARRAIPFTSDSSRLLTSVTDTGGVESLLGLVYHFAAMSAPYDSLSHVGGALIGVYAQCLILGLNVPGCRHDYAAPGHGTIPVNAPEAGPQRPGNLLPPTTRIVEPSKLRLAARHPEAIRSLLEFLLK